MKRPFLCMMLLCCALCASVSLHAQLRVSSLFTDYAVLQRDQPLPIWGVDTPTTPISVTLDGVTQSTTTDANGHWKVIFPAHAAGGPVAMTIKGTSQIELQDLLYGDVWFCSGQSNMEMEMERINNATQEIAASDYPNIRLFTVDKQLAAQPFSFLECGEKWMKCSPQATAEFSAIGYLFGREVHMTHKVPVGLISSSWGGTGIIPWTSPYALSYRDDTRDISAAIGQANLPYLDLMKENNAKQAANNKIMTQVQKQPNNAVTQIKYDASDWHTMKQPMHWHKTEMYGYEGFMWIRRSFELPDTYKGGDLQFALGKIEQSDITYLNGKEIGRCDNTGKFRNYTIPAKLIKRKGKNVIAIQVLHRRNHGGGIYEGPLELRDKENKLVCKLAGEWQYSADVEPRFEKLASFNRHPSTIYNYMVSPVTSFPIKGFLWYQGENNANQAQQYQSLLPQMIDDWRIAWGQGYLPFLVVQLANFMPQDKEPRMDPWPELREAQQMATKKYNVGLASAIDCGEELDIHPKDKQTVAHRLFLQAQKLAYGEAVVADGPQYQDYVKEANRIRIHFATGESPLASRDNLTGFAIAGEDQKFYWAEAKRVSDNEVMVWSDQVQNPVAVRYAWGNNPLASLYNEAGLPASPFRTDDWKLITEGRVEDYTHTYQELESNKQP